MSQNYFSPAQNYLKNRPSSRLNASYPETYEEFDKTFDARLEEWGEKASNVPRQVTNRNNTYEKRLTFYIGQYIGKVRCRVYLPHSDLKPFLQQFKMGNGRTLYDDCMANGMVKAIITNDYRLNVLHDRNWEWIDVDEEYYNQLYGQPASDYPDDESQNQSDNGRYYNNGYQRPAFSRQQTAPTNQRRRPYANR